MANTLPYPWFLLAAAGLALLNWYAAEHGLRRLIYFSKPGVMLVLLAWFVLAARLVGGSATWTSWIFLFGGVCGLVGDIALMLPVVRFKLGLAAFLLGHLSYTLALNPGLPATPWFSGLLAAGLALLGWQFYLRLALSLQTKKLRQMRLPVLLYILAILPMAYSAIQTLWQPGWQPGPALLVALGGVFFILSDGLLAWDRFVRPIPHARPLVMITYHLAQFGILVGAAGSLY